MKSDAQLLADMRAELEWDASINDRNIVVAVQDGIVTLAGSALKLNVAVPADDIKVVVRNGWLTL